MTTQTFTAEADFPVEERREVKVYQAEYIAAAKAPAAALVVPAGRDQLWAAQRYVDRITRSAWWRREFPIYRRGDVAPPKITVHQGRQGGGIQWGRLDPNIRLGQARIHNAIPAIQDPWMILHEVAHVYAQPIQDTGHRGGHDRAFARSLLFVIRRWHGDDAGKALLQAYREVGVRYIKKRYELR